MGKKGKRVESVKTTSIEKVYSPRKMEKVKSPRKQMKMVCKPSTFEKAQKRVKQWLYSIKANGDKSIDASVGKARKQIEHVSIGGNTAFKCEKPKKSRKSQRSLTNLWDKAISKNHKLEEWIHEYNEQMEKVDETELSIIME